MHCKFVLYGSSRLIKTSLIMIGLLAFSPFLILMDFVKCEINFHPFIHNSNLYSIQHWTLARMIIIFGPVLFLLHIFTTFFLFSIWITELKTKWKINNDLHEIFILSKDILYIIPKCNSQPIITCLWSTLFGIFLFFFF